MISQESFPNRVDKFRAEGTSGLQIRTGLLPLTDLSTCQTFVVHSTGVIRRRARLAIPR